MNFSALLFKDPGKPGSQNGWKLWGWNESLQVSPTENESLLIGAESTQNDT